MPYFIATMFVALVLSGCSDVVKGSGETYYLPPPIKGEIANPYSKEHEGTPVNPSVSMEKQCPSYKLKCIQSHNGSCTKVARVQDFDDC